MARATDRATAKAFGALAVATAGVAFLMAGADPAEALPSYARQTGQPCATCHTAFPELTPYGRRFKIGGYTAGGGDWQGRQSRRCTCPASPAQHRTRMRRQPRDCTSTT